MMNIEKLKKLAEAATAGPWTSHKDGGVSARGVLLAGCGVVGGYIANSRYIAAANPAAILELIQQRDELPAKLDRAQAEIRELESKLLDATTKPVRICEACATYPCKCE